MDGYGHTPGLGLYYDCFMVITCYEIPWWPFLNDGKSVNSSSCGSCNTSLFIHAQPPDGNAYLGKDEHKVGNIFAQLKLCLQPSHNVLYQISETINRHTIQLIRQFPECLHQKLRLIITWNTVLWMSLVLAKLQTRELTIFIAVWFCNCTDSCQTPLNGKEHQDSSRAQVRDWLSWPSKKLAIRMLHGLVLDRKKSLRDCNENEKASWFGDAS